MASTIEKLGPFALDLASVRSAVTPYDAGLPDLEKFLLEEVGLDDRTALIVSYLVWTAPDLPNDLRLRYSGPGLRVDTVRLEIRTVGAEIRVTVYAPRV
jgi:hypothetical protein